MRFSIIDLQCNDIMWFAVDKNGCIIALSTGGEGNVPEYVCRSKEETEDLEDFFLNKAKEICSSTLLIDNDNNALCMDAIALANKGIFCFDVSSEPKYKYGYYKISIPDISLHLTDVPSGIRSILQDHIIDVDVSCEDHIMVKHFNQE